MVTWVWQKRIGKSTGPEEVESAKKIRTMPKTFDLDELTAMSKEDLIGLVQGLQEAAVQHTHFLQALAETSGNRAGKAAETPEKIPERARKIRDICHKKIGKQMKWQPSCKKGSSRWSYECVVPSTEVFNQVFRVEEGAKPRK